LTKRWFIYKIKKDYDKKEEKMKKIKYVAFLMIKSIAFILFSGLILGTFHYGSDKFLDGLFPYGSTATPWFFYFIIWVAVATIFVTPAVISVIKKMIGQKENASI
jgi:hypothetical protein